MVMTQYGSSARGCIANPLFHTLPSSIKYERGEGQDPTYVHDRVYVRHHHPIRIVRFVLIHANRDIINLVIQIQKGIYNNCTNMIYKACGAER